MSLKCMATEGLLRILLWPHLAGIYKTLAKNSLLSESPNPGSFLGAERQGCDIYYYEYHLY